MDLQQAIEHIKNNQSDYVGYLPIEALEDEILEELSGHEFIYRAVDAPSLDKIDVENLGRYWTHNPDKAKAYWGDNKETFVFKALFNPSEVDWLETVEQYLKPQYAGEDEIRLLEGITPEVINIYTK